MTIASSLPLVVSDWNGYKDLVKPSFNGFRVPTQMLSSSLSSHDSVDRSYGLGFLPYDNMIGLRSMLTTIDHEKLYRTLKLFLIHPHLKHTLGHNSRQLWESNYSWDSVVPQYRALWSELSSRRCSASHDFVDAPLPIPLSGPFHGYPT